MKRMLKLISAVLAVVTLLSGCELSSDGKKSSGLSVPTVGSNLGSSTSDVPTESASENSEEAAPKITSYRAPDAPVYNNLPTTAEPQPDEARFSFDDSDYNVSEPYYVPESAEIRIPSVTEALSDFSAIENKSASGTSAEIVRTLLEKNVLCFAMLNAQCWTFDDEYAEDFYYARGTAPINSKYLKSTEQIDDLFYGTYTKDKADYLIHYYDGKNTINAFYENDDGELCATFSEILKTANESFKTPTYACITSSTKNRIEFNRYYTQSPKEGMPQPNNFTFAAVRKNGEWRLENYIIDAPSYAPLYQNLIQTSRAGSPDLVNFAVKQAGNFGGEPCWDWYGFDDRIEWCGAFVSWCYHEAGMDGPFFTFTHSEGIEWFVEQGQFRDSTFREIAPGDCVFFDWDLDGWANHVGMVIGTDGKKLYTIEGNRCDTCRTCEYDLDDDRIIGYGIIDWNKYN